MMSYYIRAGSEQEATAALQLLGVLNAEGIPTDPRTEWVRIGTLTRATGQFTEDPDTEALVEIREPICDGSGLPYWHGNLLFAQDLASYAHAQLAAAVDAGDEARSQAIAVLLSEQSQFFPIDDAGMPRAPRNPQVKFAGL